MHRHGARREISMRVMLLLSVVMIAACSIRQEAVAPGYETPSGGLSLAPVNPNVPTSEEDRYLACPGGLAKGSTIQDYRDGTADPFCN